MKTFRLKHIETEAEYNAALSRIDELINCEESTPEYDELITIGDLVYVYEDKHHKIAPPDPIDLLNFKLEEGEIVKKEFFEVVPDKTTRSLILSRKRRIPLDTMYQMIQKGWVPAESFFLPSYYELVK